MYTKKNLNVVIPMAGAGSRFSKTGYTLPKPLIEFRGKPMIQHVVENLDMDATFTFIVQQAHIDKYSVDSLLNQIAPGCNIVPLTTVTDGAARSLLHTSHIINNHNPLLVVNSDNLIEWDSTAVMQHFDGQAGGIILTEASGPKWSYAQLDSAGYATKIAEKVQISNHATTGHYYWGAGSDFVDCAREMIGRDIRFNNEFYVAPVYNIAIERGLRIATYPADKFWSVGTPEDLAHYLENN